METNEKRPGIPLRRIKAALSNHQSHLEEMGDSIKALRERCFLKLQVILITYYGNPGSTALPELNPLFQEL